MTPASVTLPQRLRSSWVSDLQFSATAMTPASVTLPQRLRSSWISDLQFSAIAMTLASFTLKLKGPRRLVTLLKRCTATSTEQPSCRMFNATSPHIVLWTRAQRRHTRGTVSVAVLQLRRATVLKIFASTSSCRESIPLCVVFQMLNEEESKQVKGESREFILKHVVTNYNVYFVFYKLCPFFTQTTFAWP